MKKLLISRRRLLGVGAASASSLILAGCDQFDFLRQGNDPTRNFLEGPLGGAQADALQRTVARAQGFQPLHRQDQVGAALGRCHRVDLVDDHGIDGP